MKELVKVTEAPGGGIVEARELHLFLESSTKFATWIERRIEEYGFIEGQDFMVFPKNGKNSKGGRPLKEYSLSLDMAKELAMVERSEKGRMARQYFIEIEKRYRKAFYPFGGIKKERMVDLDVLPYKAVLKALGLKHKQQSLAGRIGSNPTEFAHVFGVWYVTERYAMYMARQEYLRQDREVLSIKRNEYRLNKGGQQYG